MLAVYVDQIHCVTAKEWKDERILFTWKIMQTRLVSYVCLCLCVCACDAFISTVRLMRFSKIAELTPAKITQMKSLTAIEPHNHMPGCSWLKEHVFIHRNKSKSPLPCGESLVDYPVVKSTRWTTSSFVLVPSMPIRDGLLVACRFALLNIAVPMI